MYGFNSFYIHFLLVYLCYALLINKAFPYNNNQKSLNSLRKKQVLILAIPLIILGVLRGDTVGGDLENYIPHFERISRISGINKIWDVSLKEPGYQVLVYFISKVWPSHRGFLFITSFLSLIGPFYLIYRYSPKITFSFFLYYALGFYTNTFNNIRQSLALSVCFLAVPFLLDRNFRKFIILVILATSFHYSAIFFSILYPLFGMNFKIKKIIFILIISILLYLICSVSIMKSLLQIMSFKYDPDYVGTTENKGWSLLGLYLFILISELMIYYKYCSNREFNYRKKVLSYCIYTQLLCCIFQMYAPLFPSMTRLTQYFYIPIIIIVPILMKEFKRLSAIISITYISISILFLSMVYRKSSEIESNSQGVIPYVLVETVIY